MLKHSVKNRMLGLSPVVFSLKTLGFRPIFDRSCLRKIRNECDSLKEGEKGPPQPVEKNKGLAPRGGFEPPTFRLTAEQPTSSGLAGVGHNRRKSASCD